MCTPDGKEPSRGSPAVLGTCATCRFYGQSRNQTAESTSSQGGCRRRAPIGSGYGAWTWPLVETHDWCGDYEKSVRL